MTPQLDMSSALNIHGSCVAWADRAVLITGGSGCGKSALALDLMAFGCDLVADDRTILTQSDGVVWCSAPPALAGLIEARFVGLLKADVVRTARLAFALDLDHDEVIRLPPQRSISYIGVKVPLIYRPHGGHFAAAVLQYLRAGRSEI